MKQRKTTKTILGLSFLVLVVSGACRGQATLANNDAQLTAPALKARVDDLLSRMTLEEKIGQLSLYSAGRLDGPATKHDSFEALIARGEVGALDNAVGAERTNALQRVAVEQSRLHIPLLLAKDVIHGDRTIYPMPIGLAASFDPEMVERLATLAAAESRADGINWVFSPMVDIARDARWGRIAESAGEDVLLSRTMAAAYVRGYQGRSLAAPTSVAACVKHYAAYGAAQGGRDYNTVDMSEWSLRGVYLQPYQAAVKAGSATLMTSFNSINGVPVSGSEFLLKQILRDEWRFKGMVISDWGAVRELIAHGVAGDAAAATAMSLKSGVDMDLEGDLYRTELEGLVKSGQVPMQEVDDAVRSVLSVKFALGLFERPYTPVGAAYVATEEKRRQARSAATETMVLLKNDGGPSGPVLPLRRTQSIALIGPLSDSKKDMLGSWPGYGNVQDVVTLKESLDANSRRNHTTLRYAHGTDILGDSEAGFAEALYAAKQSDVVVMALGEDGPLMTGEASSRSHIDLPGNQEQLLEAVSAVGKPIVLVLFSGRPLALPWAAKHVAAMVEAWMPGMEAGPAIADILYGDENPSGKLPVSFPYSVGQEPLSYTQFPTGRWPEGVDYSHYGDSRNKFSSRYLDEPNTALFPFGWGLSYTHFTFGAPSVNRATVSVDAFEGDKTPIQLAIEIKNDGTRAGTDVVQVYLHRRSASVEQPMRELKAFQRVDLKAGESKFVRFDLGFEAMSLLNRDLKRVIEAGDIELYAGDSSLADGKAAFKITP
jgi:beta-glucosidase